MNNFSSILHMRGKIINNNAETIGGNGNISARRSNRTFKPPDRLDSVS